MPNLKYFYCRLECRLECSVQNKNKMDGIHVGSLCFAVLISLSLCDACEIDDNPCDELDELTVVQTGLGACGQVASGSDLSTSPTVKYAKANTVSNISFMIW